MVAAGSSDIVIRPAAPSDYAAIGTLLVSAYGGLPGMPGPDIQPEYFAMLRDVASRAAKPSLTVWVAAHATGRILGSIDYIADMADYGVPAVAHIRDASGVRLLAVDPASQGQGIGKALMLHCIEVARADGRNQLLLHTTKAMMTAWAMYERLGFKPMPLLDFQRNGLEIFGFALPLKSIQPA